jgi:hypothetical protein
VKKMKTKCYITTYDMVGTLGSNDPATGLLSGWQYRESHVINSAPGVRTNYCVKITAYYNATTLLSASNAPSDSITTTGYLGENIVYDSICGLFWYVFEDRSTISSGESTVIGIASATSLNGPWTVQSTSVISETVGISICR